MNIETTKINGPSLGPYTPHLTTDKEAQMSYITLRPRGTTPHDRTIQLDQGEGLWADIDIYGNITGIEIFGITTYEQI